MKVSFAASTKSPNYVPPPIPLEKEEKVTTATLKKGEYADFKLLSRPTDPNSAEYTLSLVYFKKGSTEDWLTFRSQLGKVFRGMNIEEGDDAVAIVRDVLHGEALRAFNTKLSEMADPISMDDVNECIDAVTKTLFPHRALARQKRYMRRFMRKPAGMPIRTYVARIYELNEYLKEFPPFGEHQALSEDELVEHQRAKNIRMVFFSCIRNVRKFVLRI